MIRPDSLALLGAVSLAWLWSSSPALASDGDGVPTPQYSAKQGEGETDLLGKLGQHSSSSAGSIQQMHGARQSAARPALERRLVPACSTNVPGVPDEPSALCAAATQFCASVGRQGISYWVYTRPAGEDVGWRLAGQQCLGPGEVARGAGVVPVVTVEDFRRLPLPAGVVHVQPGNGRTLVNVPTNVYLEASTRVIPTVVLGQPVRVRATPVSYLWSFGDGGQLRTTDPGAPYPQLRTTHVYTRAGEAPIGLTTTYRGEYSIAAGTWVPIEGTAQVITLAVNVTVVSARSELVDAPLPS